MKKFASLIFMLLALSASVFAHQAFTLVSSEKKTIKKADLVALEKTQTIGKQDKTNLTFTENVIRLVVVTGPEEDMLSFWIQGMRNPTLVVPTEATLRLLFVNIDVDMKHDIRFGHIVGDFVVGPSIANTIGSGKIAMVEDGNIQGEEMVIRSEEDGRFKYFCSVGGHAKGGMWGNIVVGVKPGNLKLPQKTTHGAHDEKTETIPGMTKDEKPTDKKDAHDMSNMPGMKKDDNMKGMDHAGGPEMKMSSSVNVGDPMEREASGTAWNPDSSPVYGKMKMLDGGGMLMLMGTAFVRYTSIGSSRDVSIAGEGSRSRADAPTMFMLMYSKPINEKSQFGFRGMMSLDPIIQRGWGYPLLYQSGELYKGQPIHDRQHPHDLFSELAFTYSYKFDDKKSFYVYAGYPGEPALGPPVFMHRASAANNPDAPIGHHWQDATHITWGVVTGGFSFGKAKIEASAFNGREPDENRWNFDKPRLNSFSARFSVNPTKNLAFQISYGYLRDPERAEPEIRILRKTTASAIYNKRFGDTRNWASTFVWGQNYANGERSNSFLFESNYDFQKNAVFGRFETVKKSGHDLVLSHPLDHESFWVNAVSLGYLRDVVQNKGIDVGLGSMLTINTNPSSLAPVYGGTTHTGWQVFLRLRPSKMKH